MMNRVRLVVRGDGKAAPDTDNTMRLWQYLRPLVASGAVRALRIYNKLAALQELTAQIQHS
jgi:hypothetical protein